MRTPGRMPPEPEDPFGGGVLARFAAYEGGGNAHPEALPVKDWSPVFCGDIDMVIRRDGSWWHEGVPILRTALVRLFARILRREGDAYFLVTPVEKIGIKVEDVPFIAVEMTADDRLAFRTNAGDMVTADSAHPLRFETGADGGFVPYVMVRDGLEARLSQAVARDLGNRVEIAQKGGVNWLGIWSGGQFFAIAPE